MTNQAMSHCFLSLFLGLNVVANALKCTNTTGSIQLKDCRLDCSFLNTTDKEYLRFLKRDFQYSFRLKLHCSVVCLHSEHQGSTQAAKPS